MIVPIEHPDHIEIDYLAAPIAVIILACFVILLMVYLQLRAKPEMI